MTTDPTRADELAALVQDALDVSRKSGEVVARAVLAAGWSPPADDEALDDLAAAINMAAIHKLTRLYADMSDRELQPAVDELARRHAVPPADANAPGLRERLLALIARWEQVRLDRLPEGVVVSPQQALEDCLFSLRALLATQPDKAEGEA